VASDFGLATQGNGTRSANWLTMDANGQLFDGATPIILIGDHLIETACGFDSDTEIANSATHVAATGATAVRAMGFDYKRDPLNSIFAALPWEWSISVSIGDRCSANGNIYVCDQGGTTAGSGAGPSGTGANIADGTARWDYVSAYSAIYNETFFVQLDKTLEAYSAKNIRTWVGFNHPERARLVANLAPNTAYKDTSHQDHGMMWSDTWMDAYETHIAVIMDRVSTASVPGSVAYKNNPLMSVWQPFNEQGIAEAFAAGYFDARPPASTAGVVGGRPSWIPTGPATSRATRQALRSQRHKPRSRRGRNTTPCRTRTRT
jgi:hypothetical protein